MLVVGPCFFLGGGGGVPVVGLAPTLKKASTAAAARFWIPLCVQCTARSMSFCSFEFSLFSLKVTRVAFVKLNVFQVFKHF